MLRRRVANPMPYFDSTLSPPRRRFQFSLPSCLPVTISGHLRWKDVFLRQDTIPQQHSLIWPCARLMGTSYWKFSYATVYSYLLLNELFWSTISVLIFSRRIANVHCNNCTAVFAITNSNQNLFSLICAVVVTATAAAAINVRYIAP